MPNSEARLRDDIFEPKEFAATRDGFGRGVVEAARENPDIVVLSADLSESTRAEWIEKEFPDRFIEAGISEQNMAAVAAGFALAGKTPFITSYAMFNGGRNWEQIRTVIALNDVHVAICGMHAGVSVGPDGATHQALEDIALMRVLPNMTVVSPCDAEEARKATIAAARYGKPIYLRFGREKTSVMTTAETPFEIGKARVFLTADNPQAVIFATGSLLHHALRAAKQLGDSGTGINVVNIHTIKPLDRETVLMQARTAGAVVTVEEHQIAGGMGSAIAELLSQEAPMPIEFVGVRDLFGQSGAPAELIEHYGMGVQEIIEAIRSAMNKKR